MDGASASHLEDEKKIRRYRYMMKVTLFLTDVLLLLIGWLAASESDLVDKTIFQVVQGILLAILSGCYAKSLYFKFYPGPTVTENKLGLGFYRTMMFLFLIGIDGAQVWLTLWPVEDKTLNAEIQAMLLGVVSILYLSNLYINRYIATSGEETYMKGVRAGCPEEGS